MVRCLDGDGRLHAPVTRGEMINGRMACHHPRRCRGGISWHTHHQHSKGYPSGNDVLSVVKHGIPSLIATAWGVWWIERDDGRADLAQLIKLATPSENKKEKHPGVLLDASAIYKTLYRASEQGCSLPQDSVIEQYITEMWSHGVVIEFVSWHDFQE